MGERFKYHDFELKRFKYHSKDLYTIDKNSDPAPRYRALLSHLAVMPYYRTSLSHLTVTPRYRQYPLIVRPSTGSRKVPSLSTRRTMVW